MTSLCIFLATNISEEYGHKHTTANTVFVSPLSDVVPKMLMTQHTMGVTGVQRYRVNSARPWPFEIH